MSAIDPHPVTAARPDLPAPALLPSPRPGSRSATGRELDLRPRQSAPQPAVPLSLDERTSGITVLLVLADLVAVFTAGLFYPVPTLAVASLAGVLIVCRSNARVYRRRLRLSYVDDFPRSAASVAAAFGISLALLLLFGETRAGPKDNDVIFVVLLFIAFSEFQRVVVFAVCNLARRKLGRGDRTLILGVDRVGVDLAQKMLDHPEFGLRPVGLAELSPLPQPYGELPVPVLGGELSAVIVENRIGTVLLAMPGAEPTEIVEAAITANRLGCSILMLPRMHELYRDSPDVERLHGYPLVRLFADPTRRVSWWVKRTVDVLVGALALALVAPILIATAIAVYLESGRPLIFAQERVGLDGRRFTIYKLRSMRPADVTESQTTWTIAGDPRVGPVGRMLRRTSLDELPQLWNVVRGDMSLVGPRPERPGFVAEFTAAHEHYGARHRVPAGLTGLAQVNGLRGDTSIADRARFDNYYIANWSLWLDLKIAMMTLREVLRRGEH